MTTIELMHKDEVIEAISQFMEDCMGSKCEVWTDALGAPKSVFDYVVGRVSPDSGKTFHFEMLSTEGSTARLSAKYAGDVVAVRCSWFARAMSDDKKTDWMYVKP